MDNPYLDSVKQALPRLLGLIDRDPTSDSYGMGDRYHWAWGLIDFGNGTFQGAAHGMARLWRSGLWPYATDRSVFLARIDALFSAATRLSRTDGSLEEAFPYEGSFCVTALVAFDLLCAIELLQDELPSQTFERWRAVVQPMVGFLISADESHAVISNHLAAAVAALARWHKLSGDSASEQRAKELLERILSNQSDEGWYREYDGADPGYQSLCTYYLADVHLQRPDWGLQGSLDRSFRFVWYFAHPDGSFGGIYGSRCTRFFYPAGFEVLGKDSPEAAALAEHMRTAIAASHVVTLASMDEPNLVPMFNAYCWSAAVLNDVGLIEKKADLPAVRNRQDRKIFPDAGLFIDSGPTHYTIVSTHKGGVVAHFYEGRMSVMDAGVILQRRDGQLGSTQALSMENSVRVEGDILVVESPITEMPRERPTPMQFLLLRMLCVSAFRVAPLREWIKRLLVRMLITRRKPWPARNIRRIHLGADLSISDETISTAKFSKVDSVGPFVAIHMASQGYWQIQDEETSS